MWDERYSAEEYAYGTLPNDFLVQHVNLIPRGRVLCLAEGEGRNAVYLAKMGCDVVAVDSSTEGLKKARKLADENAVSIKTILADLRDFEIEENSYDAIISIFCHLPAELRQRLHRDAVRGLRQNGVMLLEAYTPEQLKFKTGGPQIVELTMKLEDLLSELKGLETSHATELERDVIEGIYHTGRGAVVQFIGIKK